MLIALPPPGLFAGRHPEVLAHSAIDGWRVNRSGSTRSSHRRPLRGRPLPLQGTGVRRSSPSGSQPWRAPRRAARSSLACTIIAATSRAASRFSPSSARAWTRRSSRSTTSLYHLPERRPLQDVLTCIREKCTIRRGGPAARRQCRAAPEAARREMARLFARLSRGGRPHARRSPKPAASRSTS